MFLEYNISLVQCIYLILGIVQIIKTDISCSRLTDIEIIILSYNVGVHEDCMMFG